MLLFPIFQRTFKAVVFDPQFYRSAKVTDPILLTKSNFKKFKKYFDFFDSILVKFFLRTIPFLFGSAKVTANVIRSK